MNVVVRAKVNASTDDDAQTFDQIPATAGERAHVCLRIRPALPEEEGQDNTALQCDRTNKLVWALGDTEQGGAGACQRL